MAKSTQSTPKLAVSIPMAKSTATAARLDALVPNLASDLSPVLVYLPGADNELVENGTGLGVNDFGWTAPDLNNGQPYTVQVEVFGAAGGGGGGAVTGTGGGGGGAGGEYACEPFYPVNPGETYSYFAGKGGLAGKSSVLVNGVPAIPGANGAITQFDPRGKGLTGGVLANGGQGGDQTGLGIGGRGGTGSANTIHFDGGDGGTSSAGIMSDNPWLGQGSVGPAHVALWWRLDDQAGTLARDYTSHVRNSVGVTKGTGAIVAPTTEIACPVQVPFGAGTTWNGQPVAGEVMNACWKFSHGTGSGVIGGITAPSISIANLPAFTVSAWVRGAANAANSGDWTDGTHTGGVIATNKNIVNAADPGWYFTIGYDGNGNPNLVFSITNSSGTNQRVGCAGPSAVDGNWHMVTATYSVVNNAVKIFVDGAQQVSNAPTITSLGAGGQPISVGFNKATNSFGFKGYMSNIWLQTSDATSAYVSEAFGASPATGGSGGGASGGSAGTGNAGSSAITTSGGAAGASAAATNPGINTGSGAGGAGGNANSAGSNAPTSAPYAGGGGGAGSQTAGVPSEFQIEVPCSMSASYAGLDAQGAGAGQLYTVSADPRANETDPWYNTAAKQDAICYSGGASDAPFKGSMNTLVTFPSLAAVDGNSGPVTDYLSSADWTLQKTYLKLTVETTNACNLIIGPWDSNAIIPALDSDPTLTTWGYGGAALTVYIPAGAAARQVYIDLSGTSLTSTMVSSAYNNGFAQNGKALMGMGLLIGTLQGSALYEGNIHGAWNADEGPDWYCAFHGADVNNPQFSAALEFTYTASSASVITAGNGGDGYIVVRFLDPKGTPVATVLPAAAVDAGGNALGAGFSADSPNYNVWQPGSSPKVLEVSHTFSPVNGWATANGVTCCYQLMPGNLLYLNFSVNGNAASNAVVITLPSGWRPATTHIMPLAPNSASAPVTWCIVTSDGHVSIINGSGNFTYSLSTVIKLDV